MPWNSVNPLQVQPCDLQYGRQASVEAQLSWKEDVLLLCGCWFPAGLGIWRGVSSTPEIESAVLMFRVLARVVVGRVTSCELLSMFHVQDFKCL